MFWHGFGKCDKGLKPKKMKNQLSNTSTEIAKIEKTYAGLVISGESYLAQSGFAYFSGIRKFGDLNIIEDVSVGTAVSYLVGVRVFDKNNTLIIDKRMAKGCFYEREKARLVAREELVSMLVMANEKDPHFDEIKARTVIDMHLEKAYYSQSQKAVSEWYNDLLMNEI